jgi:flagellar biosynthesis regulator FlaF
VHGKRPQRRSRREGFERGSSEQDFTSAVQAANYSRSVWRFYLSGAGRELQPQRVGDFTSAVQAANYSRSVWEMYV